MNKKLLQKAGFHEKTNSFYLAKTTNAEYELNVDGEYRDWNEECEKAVYNAVMSAPTLSEVCDWLRENKNLKIWDSITSNIGSFSQHAFEIVI